VANYLVTGGAGFIASHLSEALVQRGHRVRVVDNFATGYQHNVRQGVEFVEGDLADSQVAAGAVMGMDYVLGRNASDQSYVTGYGDRPLENPYHRFWCVQANPKYPPPPPGILSGGPNSAFEDPYMQSAGLQGCAPQKCFMDNGEAWSANEVTINWNAPLFWVAAYLDEKVGPHAGKGGAGGKRK
jgi:hypothetical protein